MKPETEILVDLIIDIALIMFAIIVMALAVFDYTESDLESLVVVLAAIGIRCLGYLSRIHRRYVD